ncbi:MAG: MFS transporter [Ruminococcaceae bacterium]|nr:MFS transporter [Oscillospiraceae bacterium]
MSETISKRAKCIAYLLMLVYFGSYIMRINVAAMLVTIYTDMAITKTAISPVITGMTIFYGAGQIINGILGDKIKPKYMLTVGLLLAAACNIAMFCCGIVPFMKNVPCMTVVWCINGYAHAMLWPPIVRLLSANLTDAEYSYAAVRVSWGSSFGTILIYSLCPLLLNLISWNAIILCFAIMGLAIAAIWVLLYPRFFHRAPQAADSKSAAPVRENTTAIPLPAMVFLPIVLIFIGIVLQGMLRDGVTNWMPSFLLESFGLSESQSIFATVILAVFSIISFSVFDLLHRKVFRNEVTCSAVIFGGSAVFGLILYFANLLIPADNPASVIVSMLLMAAIVACMHGINLMLITVVPKRFIKSGKVATFSGLLNAGTYVGAAIATPLFAVFADNAALGWSFTLLSWAIISALGCIVCLVIVPMWTKFRREYADAPVPATAAEAEETDPVPEDAQ